MTPSRRNIKAEEKAIILRKLIVDKIPISNLSDQFGIQPTQIYQWRKLLLENAADIFEQPKKKTKTENAKDRKIENLKAKIQLKNEVVAELLQEHVQLKKELGEP